MIASRVPEEYAPSGYDPLISKLTYGPAMAAPEASRGAAARAAIEVFNIFFKVSRK